jgi:dephospho-CoA kinase
MKLIGLTGGIGAGKSSVSALLAARGAVIIDADAITHQMQAPGQPVLAAMVERFGDGILTDDGALDRQAMAAIVFADPEARKALEEIVWPAVGAETLRIMQEHADTDDVVVYDVPLLAEAGRTGFAGVIVVDVDPDIAVQRIVVQRGMDEADARARIANQASREVRLAIADHVIDNSGTREDLERSVDAAWAWICTLNT